MKVKVELEIEINGNYDMDDVENFLEFELGYNGGLSADSPLYKDDVDWSVTDFYCDER